MPKRGKPARRGGARVPSDDELRRITTRAVAEIVPHQEFVDGLRSGRRLRLKMGFDPTVPVITLGWAVGLRKLRQLQDLGHTVVVIIGDWTARIGDPSGQSQTRPMLSAEEVKANSEAILRQFYKVLDESRTEIRRQSEWFDPFTLTDVVRLAERFTVAQMLQRDDFAERYGAHRPIGLHELMYPLLQAYDSVAVEADVEFGGTDQKFNNLLGREMQRAAGQKAAQTGGRLPGPAGEGQAVFLVPMLVGLDGKQKMSQTLGNYIAIDDPPHDMYGKLMSITDSLMMDYFELLTDVAEDELAHIRAAAGAGGEQAMDAKMRLAREIVTQFHSEPAAREAKEGFVRTFRKGETPEDVVEFHMSFEKSSARLEFRGTFEGQSDEEAVVTVTYYLPRVLNEARVVSSISEAQRLIKQGAIGKFVDGQVQTVTTQTIPLEDGDTFRVGKHRFLRIVDADKRR